MRLNREKALFWAHCGLIGLINAQEVDDIEKRCRKGVFGPTCYVVEDYYDSKCEPSEFDDGIILRCENTKSFGVSNNLRQ